MGKNLKCDEIKGSVQLLSHSKENWEPFTKVVAKWIFFALWK